jgi:hypothetical protein
LMSFGVDGIIVFQGCHMAIYIQYWFVTFKISVHCMAD